MNDARAAEVDALLQRLAVWAAQRSDVRALALVGSWAYEEPHANSDVDIVLLTREPALFIDRDEWLGELGANALIRTANWGVITERRVAVANGLEVEIGVGTPAWASTDPVDAGTLRVVADGMRILHDPDGLLAALAAAC